MTWKEALDQLGARALASRWSLEPPHPEELAAVIVAEFAAERELDDVKDRNDAKFFDLIAQSAALGRLLADLADDPCLNGCPHLALEEARAALAAKEG